MYLHIFIIINKIVLVSNFISYQLLFNCFHLSCFALLRSVLFCLMTQHTTKTINSYCSFSPILGKQVTLIIKLSFITIYMYLFTGVCSHLTYRKENCAHGRDWVSIWSELMLIPRYWHKVCKFLYTYIYIHIHTYIHTHNYMYK